MRKKYGLLFIYLFICTAMAEPTTIALEYEERYHAILNELRCLVCQNQTIAESDADLAKDLRDEVRKMLEGGASSSDIIDFMVTRYGDFVLYKPLVQPKTYLLWFGPFVFLAVALIILILIVKRQRQSVKAQLSTEEQTRISSILDQTKE